MYAQTLQFQGHQQSQFRKEGQNFRLDLRASGGHTGSRQGKPGKGESYVDSGNSLMESSGFDSHPAKVSHQPEASLA